MEDKPTTSVNPTSPPEVPTPVASPLPQNIYPSPRHIPKTIKRVSITLLSLILIIIGINYASEYLFGIDIKYILFKQSNLASMPPANEISENDTTGVNQTSDEKTYKNDKYGFEFKYPAEYSIIKQTNDQVVLQPENSGSDINLTITTDQSIQLSDYPQCAELSEKNPDKTPYELGKCAGEVTSTTLDGREAQEFVISNPGPIGVLQTTEDSPPIQISMFLGGGSLSNHWNMVKRTFKFTDKSLD